MSFGPKCVEGTAGRWHQARDFAFTFSLRLSVGSVMTTVAPVNQDSRAHSSTTPLAVVLLCAVCMYLAAIVLLNACC